MKVLFDTNVLLDIVLRRQQFLADSQHALNLASHRVVEGFVAPSSLATIFYICDRHFDDQTARRSLLLLLQILDVIPMPKAAVQQALASGMADCEDAMLAFSAAVNGINVVVTRDIKGFRNGPIHAWSPAELRQKNP